MYDINKYLNDERLMTRAFADPLAELPHWSPRVANHLAEAEGIALSEEHFAVLSCLRELYREMGPDWNAREVTRRLEKNFASEGGRRYLYGLFPGGPLAQGCRLAGLPLPQGTLNPSFGSVH